MTDKPTGTEEPTGRHTGRVPGAARRRSPGRESMGSALARQLGPWASLIAPASLISGLLFYFGYVSSRAQYEYFGIDVDTIGLSTQDYIMRSPQPLLTPLLTLTIVGVGLLLAHNTIRAAVARRGATTSGAGAVRRRRLFRTRLAIRAALVLGVAVLCTSVVLLLGYPLIETWPAYNLVVAVLVILGAGLTAYTWYLLDLLPPGPAGKPDPATAAPLRSSVSVLRRTARVLLCLLLIVATFWAVATVAQWSGRGLARDIAAHPERLPRVILDTKERLYLRSAAIEETVLPTAAGQTFHYRYRRLRLLVVGHDRMFLIPETWSASNATLVLPIDDSVRIQLQFQNDAP